MVGQFQVTVILKERVDPVILQQALDVTIRRFLNFRLKLHKGLFWYYLEEGKGPYVVEPDVANPCMRFGKDRSGGQLSACAITRDASPWKCSMCSATAAEE